MYQKTKAACEFKILDIQTSMNGTPEQQQRKEEETQTLTTKLRENDEELKRTKERVTKLTKEKRKKGKSTFRLRKNCILTKEGLYNWDFF